MILFQLFSICFLKKLFVICRAIMNANLKVMK